MSRVRGQRRPVCLLRAAEIAAAMQRGSQVAKEAGVFRFGLQRLAQDPDRLPRVASGQTDIGETLQSPRQPGIQLHRASQMAFGLIPPAETADDVTQVAVGFRVAGLQLH